MNAKYVHEEDQEIVALGATHYTDSLFIGIRDVPVGLDLTPYPEGHKKAGWYSLGFMLREAAARLLDIQSSELNVGLRVSDVEPPEIFLSDDAANGAGFSTHLAEGDVFQELVLSADEYLAELDDPEKHDCDTSCYDCLREYYNMAFHPLLDWRLARDMLHLGQTGALDLAPWHDYEGELAKAVSEEFDGSAFPLGEMWGVNIPSHERLLIVTHPFEDTREAAFGARIAVATAEAELRIDDGEMGPYYVNTFDLTRRMGLAVLQTLT